MKSDPEYNHKIEKATPLTNKDLRKVEIDFGFIYRQGIGELIYGMVTCRPDISFPLIKLSQYSMKPALKHFTAMQGLYNYIRAKNKWYILLANKTTNGSSTRPNTKYKR